MNLNEIAVFARVVAAGSFSEAARQLGLPKSTVSRAVTRLEQRLGVRLLQRSTRKLNLTDAGTGYYSRVSDALGLIDDAESAVTELQADPSGVLRVTAPYDIGAVLGELLPAFVDRYPQVQIDIVLTGRTVDLIAEGFDLALRAGRLQDSSLVARKLGEVSFRLYATPGYLEAHGIPQTPDDLREHNCVLFRPRAGKSVWRLNGPEGMAEVTVTGSIWTDEYSFLRTVVCAGGGIGLMPWFSSLRDLEAGRLLQLLPEHEARGGGLHLVYPSIQHLPRKVVVFRDFLLEHLSLAPHEVVQRRS